MTIRKVEIERLSVTSSKPFENREPSSRVWAYGGRMNGQRFKEKVTVAGLEELKEYTEEEQLQSR